MSTDKVNILLVDDQPGKLLTYEAILSDLDENLIKASSGKEALEHLLETEFALVLLDVCMPNIDGFELAGLIRQHPRCQKTAIIFVTAVASSDLDRLKGYESGAVDYVSVPIEPELLRARVTVFADLFRKTRALERLNQELEQRVAERTADLEAELAERKRTEAALRQSEAHFRLLVEGLRDYAILTLDMEERISSWNPGAERIFGYSEKEVIGQSFELLFTPKDQAGGTAEAEVEQAQATGRGDDERWHVRKDGSRFFASGMVTPLHDEFGQIRGFVKIARDITERKRDEEALRDSEALNSSLMESSADCVNVLNTDGKLLFMNGPGMSLMEIDDFSPFIGRAWAELWPSRVRPEPIAAVTKALAGAVGRFQELCPTAKGTPKWWDVMVTPVRNAAGEIVRLLSVARDTTASKQSEDRLVYLANYDTLTELPNRVLFMDRMTHELAVASRHKQIIAILFLDLDGFKHINDTLGHEVGDRLLKSVAARLVGCVRSSDTVGRFGGDEFVLILADIARMNDANRVAQKILRAISKPVALDGTDLFVTASIGISFYPDDGQEAHGLLKNADAAMYLAKQGGNSYQQYSLDLSVQASSRMTLDRALRRALERDEFVLHYQPQINLASGQIDTVEALLRWRSPDSDQLVPPDGVYSPGRRARPDRPDWRVGDTRRLRPDPGVARPGLRAGAARGECLRPAVPPEKHPAGVRSRPCGVWPRSFLCRSRADRKPAANRAGGTRSAGFESGRHHHRHRRLRHGLLVAELSQALSRGYAQDRSLVYARNP
ncbi:MAG: diguanylate cyclase [Gammaproteobacteria bacterium]|nr:diguanylate cyclase [Gammaproteobacteria bacterium]